MSCENCEQAQRGRKKAYYRWGIADIEVMGCEPHLKEVFSALNRAQFKPTRLSYYIHNEDADAFVIVTECTDVDKVKQAYKDAVNEEERLSIMASHHEPGGHYMEDSEFVNILLAAMQKIDPYAEVYWADQLDYEADE